MKIAVIGADGFIGRNAYGVLSRTHDVYAGVRKVAEKDDEKRRYIDLLEPESIVRFLNDIQPDVVISCAGVIDTAQDVTLNEAFTRNLLNSIIASGLTLKSIIVSGSAAEYGQVNESDIPVSEDTPLRAASGYGLSKVKEESIALSYVDSHNLPVVVARIFNPIGIDMPSRFLISRIMNQIEEFRNGQRSTIEIGRLDAERDYVAVEDIALALQALIESDLKHKVYNIGSGRAMSNGRLAELVLKSSSLVVYPEVVQLNQERELQVASQADIARISNETGWKPKCKIEDVVREIVHATEARE